MTELRTEEEQIELMKKWWADNGKGLLIALALAVAVVVGWKWWQADQQAKSEAASSAYEQLLNISNQPELSEEDRATALHLADRLQNEFAGSTYAQYAALFEAKLNVDQGDYDAAVRVLESLQTADSSALIQEVAAVRQAQVLWQQDKEDEALALLDKTATDAYRGNAEELRGDILSARGDTEAARTAYENAKAAFMAKGVARPVIDMKLADLGA